jgi:carbonic anhydrase/acetyltransferase-like protein (isoleucine patch superfamily)
MGATALHQREPGVVSKKGCLMREPSRRITLMKRPKSRSLPSARGKAQLVRQFETFLRRQPTLGLGVYIAAGAVVCGDVTLGDHSSIWYNAVLRGDINRIKVGHHTNVQDTAVLHLADDFSCVLGNYVTVGHSAIVHACTVGNEVLVGMRSIILDGVVIGDQTIIGAGALVTPNTKVPPGSLVLGSPARVARALTRKERTGIKGLAIKYARYAAYCLKHQINVSRPLPT